MTRRRTAVITVMLALGLVTGAAAPASAEERSPSPAVEVTATSAFTSPAAVEIEGVAQVGEVLTAVVTADAVPLPTSYTYQWFDTEFEIPGATEQTYLVEPWAVDGYLSVIATPVLDGHDGDSGARRSELIMVAPALHTGTLTVSLPTAPQASEVLTATLGGDLAPAPFYTDYTWIVDGEPLEDAWEETLDLAYYGMFGGEKIGVIVHAAAFGYEQVSATSQTVTVIPGPTVSADIVNLPTGIGLEVTGEYFLRTGPVTIEIHDELDEFGALVSSLDPDPEILATVTPDTDGRFRFEAPLVTWRDAFTLRIRTADGAVLSETDFLFMAEDESVAESADPAGDRLAESGSDRPLLPIALVGLALVAVGGFLLRFGQLYPPRLGSSR